MNVTNLAAYGNYFSNTRGVLIEKSRYQWSHNADSAINLLNVQTAILDELECVDKANRIRADAATGMLSVINSVYAFLDSEAQKTNVVETEADDDPVQYVRRQYQTMLRSEPDPAGHFYWSDLILRCEEDSQCITDKKAQLTTYLDNSPSPNFTITGRVTDEDGVALSGVALMLRGSQTVITQTDSSGQYRFSNLPTSGIYIVSASKTHYTFNIPERSVATPASDQTLDFEAAINRHEIHGRVADGAGRPVGAATVTLSGPQTATATTDADGEYSFPNLPEAGTYTLTPSGSFYVFSPKFQTIEDLEADQTVDFLLVTYSISGRATRLDGSAVDSVTLTLSGSDSVATTDGLGQYVFDNLPAGGSYTITPTHLYDTFEPLSWTINNLGANQTRDFTATFVKYTVSGQITSGAAGLSGVTVALSGSETGTATTDANGAYSFTLSAKGSYTFTPSNKHYTFTPQSRTLADLTGPATADFVGVLNPIVISMPNSTRALVFDSVLRTQEPFALSYNYPWSLDRRTRIVLFVSNLELYPDEGKEAIGVEFEDGSHRIYVLQVEYFGKIPEYNGLSRVIVRLADDLGDVGDVLARITYRGVSSNRVRIGIGHIGGGLPDDPGSVPTPGPGSP
jgi:protocatechuate 3,4-dioxygenase beta subunit